MGDFGYSDEENDFDEGSKRDDTDNHFDARGFHTEDFASTFAD